MGLAVADRGAATDAGIVLDRQVSGRFCELEMTGLARLTDRMRNGA